MNHFLSVSKTSFIIRIVWRCTWLRLFSHGTVITQRWRACAWSKWLHSNTRLRTIRGSIGLRWRVVRHGAWHGSRHGLYNRKVRLWDFLLIIEYHRNNNNHYNSSYDPNNNTSDGSARQTTFVIVLTVVIIVVIWAISASGSSCT